MSLIDPLITVFRVFAKTKRRRDETRPLSMGGEQSGGIIPAGSSEQAERERRTASARTEGVAQSRPWYAGGSLKYLYSIPGVGPFFTVVDVYANVSGKSTLDAATDIVSKASEIPREVFDSVGETVDEVVFWGRLVLIAGVSVAGAYAYSKFKGR